MDISALKQLSKQIYRQMVSRTPDIGSMMENPLRGLPDWWNSMAVYL